MRVSVCWGYLLRVDVHEKRCHDVGAGDLPSQVVTVALVAAKKEEWLGVVPLVYYTQAVKCHNLLLSCMCSSVRMHTQRITWNAALECIVVVY